MTTSTPIDNFKRSLSVVANSLFVGIGLILGAHNTYAQDAHTQVCFEVSIHCAERQEYIYYAPRQLPQINSQQSSVITRIKGYSDNCPVEKILLEGHASHTDNQDAAMFDLETQLESIRQGLTNAGFSPELIKTVNFSTRQPFVKSPIGTYEQLNSRIEVIIQFDEDSHDLLPHR